LSVTKSHLKDKDVNHYKINEMKHLKHSILSLFILSLFSISAMADTSSGDNNKELKTKIDHYVKSNDLSKMDASATIYSHFLIKEDSLIYTIDFMITTDGEIIILSKELEEDFYKVDLFNAKHVKTTSVATPTILG